MRADARLVVGPGPTVAGLRDDPPIAWRPTPEGVFLVGTAGGPTGDDAVSLDVEVRPGGDLRLRSSAATVAYAGRGSRWDLALTAGPASRISWQLEPLIVASGARHAQHAYVHLHPEAELDWLEVTVLGRHGERPGDADLRLDVDVGGRPLLRHQLRVGPAAGGWDGPAVLGGHRACATRLVTFRGVRAPRQLIGENWAWCELDGPGWLLLAVAADVPTLRTALAEAGRAFPISRPTGRSMIP